jgi:hypothetical protein
MSIRQIKTVATINLSPMLFALAFFIATMGSVAVNAQSQTFTSSQTFTVPSGITSLTVQCWGGGGAGGRGGTSNKNGGGGGAGGQFAAKTISVSSGQVYQVVVGTGGVISATNGGAGGDSYFGGNLVLAKGGRGGSVYTGTSGAGGLGSTTGGIGTTLYAGGNGASGTRQASGGGGSGAGSTGNGNSAIGTSGGIAKVVNGGAGGNGVSSNSGNGFAGGNYGGGGGGATRSGIPGAGAQGVVIVSWSTCTVTLTSAAGTNNQQVCVNSSLTPITYAFTGISGATVSGLPAGLTSSFNTSNNTLTISGNPSVIGIFNYTVTPTSGCATVTATGTIAVNALPVATLSYPNTSYCSSASLVNPTFSGTTGGVFSSTPAGLSLNASTGVISPGASLPGSYQVTYTVTSGGCSATSSTSVTIKSIPVVTCSTAGTINCQSSSTSLTATATAGAGNTITGYLWSPTGATTSSILVTNASTYTVTVTQSNGCTSTCSSAAVVDTCRPSVSIVQSNPSCGNSGKILAATAIACSGTQLSYLWSTGSVSSSVTVSTTGTYAVSVTQPSNNCTANASTTVSSLYAPLVAKSVLASFSCSGGNSTVTVSATGGTSPYSGIGSYSVATGSYTYTVTDAAGCTATTTISVPPVVPMSATAAVTTPIACYGGTGFVSVSASGGSAPYQGTGLYARPAGTYTFTVTDALGCSVVSNAVTVSQPSPLSVSTVSTATNCGTLDGSATATGSGGTPSYGYSWSNGANGSTVNGLAAGYYTVTVTDAAGCTATAQATVNINGGVLLGATGRIIGPAGACLKSIVTYSIDPVPGATAYTWTLPLNATGASTSNSITVSFDSLYSGGSICVTPSNVCQTGAQACINVPAILFKPAQPGPVTIVGNVCGPDTLTCSVAPVANTTNYVWSVSGTLAVIVGGQGTTTVRIAIPAGFTSTQLGIQTFNCLGNSTVRLQMIVGKPVVNTALTGSYTICPSTTQNYSVGTVLGATSYSWSITGDAYISSSLNNTCSVTTNAGWTGGTLTVTAYNACGSGSRSFTLYKNMLPPGAISGPFTNLCILAGVTSASYSISPVTGALSYVWTVPTGMTIVSNTGTGITVSLDSSYVAGNVCVAAVNACGTGSFRCLYTTAAPPIPTVINGPTNVCLSNSYVVYGVNSVVGAIDYNWYITGGSTLTPYGSASVVNFTTSTAPSSTIQVNSRNECGLSQPYRITVYIDGRCRQASPDSNPIGELKLYPTPSHDRVTVTYEAEETTACQLNIVGITGQLLKTERMLLNSGMNKAELNLDGIPSGMYFISLITEKGLVHSVRLVVE